MIILLKIAMFLLGFICWVLIGIGLVGILFGISAYEDGDDVADKMINMSAEDFSYSQVLTIIDIILWPIWALRIKNTLLDQTLADL